MTRIFSKQPIRQAYLQMIACQDKPDEVEFIRKYYQSWGTPEGDRIRPHFTLVYNFTGSKEETEARLHGADIPNALREIKFTHLALLAIDLWGNPVNDGVIHAVPLKPSV